MESFFTRNKSCGLLVILQGSRSRKLIRYREEEGFRYAYFDLANDPGERTDLYPVAGDAVVELRDALDRYEDRSRSTRDRLLGEDAQVPVDRLDPDVEEKLRALGYLD